MFCSFLLRWALPSFLHVPFSTCFFVSLSFMSFFKCPVVLGCLLTFNWFPKSPLGDPCVAVTFTVRWSDGDSRPMLGNPQTHVSESLFSWDCFLRKACAHLPGAGGWRWAGSKPDSLEFQGFSESHYLVGPLFVGAYFPFSAVAGVPRSSTSLVHPFLVVNLPSFVRLGE